MLVFGGIKIHLQDEFIFQLTLDVENIFVFTTIIEKRCIFLRTNINSSTKRFCWTKFL